MNRTAHNPPQPDEHKIRFANLDQTDCKQTEVSYSTAKQSAKIAVITGASSGLGVQWVRTVLSQQPELDEIWIIARRYEKMKELQKQLGSQKLRILALDLAADETYERLRALLARKKPVIQLLINNAGCISTGPFAQMSQEQILSMIRLNIQGLTMIDWLSIPYMQKGSSIIHVCSISALAPVADHAVYSASKAYVKSFSTALHQQLKSEGIRVLMVLPGKMDTQMNPRGQADNPAGPLPYLDMEKLTRRSLKLLEHNRSSYTPGLFYQLYRMLTKVLPSTWITAAVDQASSKLEHLQHHSDTQNPHHPNDHASFWQGHMAPAAVQQENPPAHPLSCSVRSPLPDRSVSKLYQPSPSCSGMTERLNAAELPNRA